MNIAGRAYHLVAGPAAAFPFEHRLFNTVSFLVTVFCVIGTTINIALGLHPATVYLGLAGLAISVAIFWIARVRGRFSNRLVLLYAIASILVLGSMYFFNAGASGTLILMLVMLMTIFLLLARRGGRAWVVGLLGGGSLLVLAIEWAFPGLAIPYSSFDEQMADHVTVTAYIVATTAFTIISFRKAYDDDRQAVLRTNTELSRLNQQVAAQNAELETANRLAAGRNQQIETLLRELHHRVKNNLQTVSSLLALQANRVEGAAARNALDEGRTRIDAMALIHQRLYLSNEVAGVDMQDYIDSLLQSLLTAYGYAPAVAHTNIRLSEPYLSIDLAIPIGLILNELLTNVFKHAFPAHPDPRIDISLSQSPDDGAILLTVSDNGAGMAGGPVQKESMGMLLLESLSRQIRATLSIVSLNGTLTTLSIPT